MLLKINNLFTTLQGTPPSKFHEILTTHNGEDERSWQIKPQWTNVDKNISLEPLVQAEK